MKKYLLDTNICIHNLKGQYGIEQKIIDLGVDNCFVSVITLIELQYGVEKSVVHKQVENQSALDNLIGGLKIIPLESCVKKFAKIKVDLKTKGQMIDNFDLLIAATAIENDLTLVTRNVKHFSRIEGLTIENWIDDNSSLLK